MYFDLFSLYWLNCIWVNIWMFFLIFFQVQYVSVFEILYLSLNIVFFLSTSRCSTCPLEARSAWNAGYRFSNSNTQIQTQIKMSHIYYNHKVKVEEMQSWKQKQNLRRKNICFLGSALTSPVSLLEARQQGSHGQGASRHFTWDWEGSAKVDFDNKPFKKVWNVIESHIFRFPVCPRQNCFYPTSLTRWVSIRFLKVI